MTWSEHRSSRYRARFAVYPDTGVWAEAQKVGHVATLDNPSISAFPNTAVGIEAVSGYAGLATLSYPDSAASHRLAPGRCRVLRSAAVTFALLLAGAHAGSPEQEPQTGAALQAAEIVWSYDTGG